jgi:hypothetical protein
VSEASDSGLLIHPFVRVRTILANAIAVASVRI